MKRTNFSVSHLHALTDEGLSTQVMMRQAFRIGLGLILVLGVVYLWQMNRLATLGFDLNTVRIERNERVKVVEKLDIEVANESTLYAFRTHPQVQEMVPRGRVSFVVKEDAGVAYVPVSE